MAEMTALEYFKEKNRMTKKCSIDCSDCPLSSEKNTTGLCCGDLQRKYPEIAVDIVEKWSKEHPRKTFLQDFLEKYPNAPLSKEGIPETCAISLGLKKETIEGCYEKECKDCWNTPVEEEVENNG